MAKAKANTAEGDEPQAATDPRDAILLQAAKAMERLASANDKSPVQPAEGLFEAKAPGGVYRVGDALVNCEGEPVDEDGNPAEPKADDEK